MWEAAGIFSSQEPPLESSESPLTAGAHPLTLVFRPQEAGGPSNSVLLSLLLLAGLQPLPGGPPVCSEQAVGGRLFRTGSLRVTSAFSPSLPTLALRPHPFQSNPFQPSLCEAWPLSLQGHVQTVVCSRFCSHLGPFISRPSKQPASSCWHSPGRSPQPGGRRPCSAGPAVDHRAEADLTLLQP